MKKAIIILIALMLIIVSCESQTPVKNDDLMLRSPSGSDYDPYKADYFRIVDGCLTPGNNYYDAGNRYWHMEEYESIEEVTAFKEGVFNGMPKLKRVKLGTSIKTIGERSFADIPFLMSVDMEEGVETIGRQAFSGNRSLEYINALPQSLVTIASDAFSGCPSLRLLCYNGTLDSWYKLGADSFNAEVLCYGNLGEREIALYRFTKDGENYTLEGLTPRGKEQSVFELPEMNITSIAANTFKGVEAESIVIPETVVSIGESAFAESGIKAVVIPGSVTTIGDFAFAESGIEEVTINGSNLESISNMAFNTTAIREVAIPASVKSIGYGAFRRCMELTTISFAEGSELESIEFNAFEKCTSLEKIIIPEGTKSIQEWAFYDCSSLTEVTIPSTVTDIGAAAFGNCSNLETVRVNMARTDAMESMLVRAGIPEGIIHWN